MEGRLDPDELLKAIQNSDKKKLEGKLRIFIGMAAGVGKTCAMLTSVREQLSKGVNVVIGIVETHGRIETEKLTENIPVIAKKKIDHRGVSFEEMDLETILKIKPDLVIVDELAHTNVPGSRHPKRWQDVIEILENGIDVYSAINIQHIESRKDDIEGITNIKIHETVPDSILERANHIEVIDIPPEDLLKRLKEGKVYLGEKADAAAKNFFKEDKLTALRQILLRFSADKVDKELESLSSQLNRDNVWKTQEKILLAIGHSPNSEKLVRTTKQIAFRLKSPWIALYVDTGEHLSEEEQKALANNLDLARELGARVITTTETDLIKGIERYCKQFNITQIVIGKPGFRPIHNFLSGGTIVERLDRLENSVSIHIVRNNSSDRKIKLEKLLQFKPRLSEYSWAFLYSIVLGVLNYFLHHNLHLLPYRSIGLLFLLGVTCAGLIFSIGPTIFASVLSVLVWNIFFIPPLFTLQIREADDIVLATSFFIVATITGSLTSIVKRNQRLLRKQEARTNTLYQLSLEIVESRNKEECIAKICSSLEKFFNAQVAITLKNDQGMIEYFKRGEDWIFNRSREWAVALWAFEKNRSAGRGTDTLPDSNCLFIPLTTSNETVGVMGFYPKSEKATLSVDDREILFTVVSQLGLYLQRELFHESALESEKLKKSERLHQTLLNSVSHEIKTPLTAIAGIADALSRLNGKDELAQRQLNNNLNESVERLKLVVDNILDISRLDSGVLALKEEWYDITEIIDNALDDLKKQLEDFSVEKKIPTNFPLVLIDGRLIEQVLTNLILNSIKYVENSEIKKIKIELSETDKNWVLVYSDNGPGIPFEHQKFIFNKFYRLPNAKSGGTGLGLSIVKSIVELHHGDIVINNSDSGLIFNISFPKHKQPDFSKENL